MKSSMRRTSHNGMNIVARFHSLPQLVGVATEKNYKRMKFHFIKFTFLSFMNLFYKSFKPPSFPLQKKNWDFVIFKISTNQQANPLP